MDINIIFIILMNIFGLLSTYVIFDFMSKFNRCIYKRKWIYIVSYIVLTLTLASIGLGIENLIITLIGTVIIGHFLYNNKKIYMLYYSIYIVMFFITQSLVGLVFSLVVNVLGIYFTDIRVYTMGLYCVQILSYFMLTRLFILFYKNKKIRYISKMQYLAYLVFPLFSIVFSISLISFVDTYMTISNVMLLMFNLILIILLNLFITNIFESISKNNELKNKVVLYQDKSRMQYDYYKSIQDKYDKSRKLIHDMKNHMITIEELYKEGSYDKASEYTSDVYSKLQNLGQRFFTDNEALNIILNDKYRKALDKGISFKAMIGDVDLSFIKDIDLITILSNLLDNAIEGASLTNEKSIVVKIENINCFVVINIINSLKEKPLEKNNLYKSTKGKDRGLGIENVKYTVEKYEGDIRITYNDRDFKVNIFLPM